MTFMEILAKKLCKLELKPETQIWQNTQIPTKHNKISIS